MFFNKTVLWEPLESIGQDGKHYGPAVALAAAVFQEERTVRNDKGETKVSTTTAYLKYTTESATVDTLGRFTALTDKPRNALTVHVWDDDPDVSCVEVTL